MKKKFLAVSVSLALGAMSGVAGAKTVNVPEAFVTGVTPATNVVAQGNIVVADNHIGTINIVPYYSVQNGNTVALTITNNDLLNGKAVKLRFRGAQWSDDVLDFQVFLSPADVWTAAIVKDPVTGVGKLSTHGLSGDQSCTLPDLNDADLNFVADVRLDTNNAGGTLEGYVEIITMADIPPTIGQGTSTVTSVDDTDVASGNTHDNPLFTITKHKANGAAPLCKTEAAAKTALFGLSEDNYWQKSTGRVGEVVDTAAGSGIHDYSSNVTLGANHQTGGANYTFYPSGSSTTVTENQFGGNKSKVGDDWLHFPTPGISTFVSVLNVNDLKAYTLQATALKNAVSHIAAGTASVAVLDEDDSHGNGAIKAYFRQSGDDGAHVDWDAGLTADKIFGNDGAGGVVTDGLGGYAGIQLLQWDLPDLSTPTTGAVAAIVPASSDAAGSVLTDGTDSYYPNGAATAQRDLVAYALQAPGFAFDYVTEPSVEGSTDVVINQPVRRYYYWYDLLPDTAANAHRQFSSLSGKKFNIYGEANTPYDVLNGAVSATGIRGGSVEVGDSFLTGREEESIAPPGSSVGASPAIPGSPTAVGLYGEVSVISINTLTGKSGALGAELTVNRLGTGHANGWVWISTEITGSRKTAGKFVPGATWNDGSSHTNTAWGLRGHQLLKGGLAATEPTGTTEVGHAHATELPFIGYTTVNVNSPDLGHQAYGTTLPVRKGPQINP
jgi:hypothetical protein